MDCSHWCNQLCNSQLQHYICEALGEINATTHDDYGRKAGGYLALMEKFSTFFGLKLGFLILSGTEQLSLSLQGKDTTVQESVNAAELAVKYLERLWQDSSFEQFYSQTVEASRDITSPPVLPRFRRPPRKPGDVGAYNHEFNSPQAYYRRQYFEALGLLIN